MRGYLFFTIIGQISVMAKTLTAYLARKKLERELFSARQRLIDLIELYDSGLWRRL